MRCLNAYLQQQEERHLSSSSDTSNALQVVSEHKRPGAWTDSALSAMKLDLHKFAELTANDHDNAEFAKWAEPEPPSLLQR